MTKTLLDVLLSLLNESRNDEKFNLQLSKASEIYNLVGGSFAEIFDSLRWRNLEDLELMSRNDLWFNIKWIILYKRGGVLVHTAVLIYQIRL